MRVVLVLLIIGLLLVGCGPPQHDLTLEFDDSKGTVLGESKYPEGENLKLEAIPEDGYQLKHWKVEGEVISEEETLSYTMPTQPITIIAVFEELFTLTLEVDQSKGTVSGEGEYVEGEAVQLSATSLEEFDFVGWKLEDEIISREPDFVFTMSDEDVVVEADFALLSINHFDEDSGWRIRDQTGEAWFEDGKIFIKWTEDDSYIAVASYDKQYFSDFILEVDVEWTGGELAQAQCVAIRRNAETFEAYRLVIIPLGFFSVEMQDEDGNLVNLHKVTHSPYIRLDKNTIRVEATGDNIRFFANNHLLVEIHDDTLNVGRLAFFVGRATKDVKHAEAAFSNLVVRLP